MKASCNLVQYAFFPFPSMAWSTTTSTRVIKDLKMVRTGRNSLLQGWSCNQRKGCVSCFSSFRTCISSLIPLGCRTSEISNPSGGRMGSGACFARKVCLYLLCCLEGITWECQPKNQMFPWSDTHYTIHLAFVTFKGHLESGVCDRLNINMSIWYSLCLDTVQVAMSVNYMDVASDSPETQFHGKW